MIEFNDELEQIEIKEYFSFENHVLPIYKDVLYDVADPEEHKKIFDYELTHEDKIEILHYIEDEFERSSNYFDNASIFDESMIKECVMTWITDNFDIEF